MDIHIELQDTDVRFSLFASSTYELTFGGLSVHMSADQFQQLCDNLRPWVVDEDEPQPAAADGGVRERARELLAETLRHDGMPSVADSVMDPDDAHRVNRGSALRAIEAALSSHRQAGDDLSKFRELAERWQKELDRSGVSNDEYNYGFDVAKSGCLYELKCILALVEKGAGS